MVDRRLAARVAAPAAFLVALTIAILLVRAGMDDADPPAAQQATAPAATATQPATTAAAPTQTQPTVTTEEPEPVLATVESGDTLASIADEHDTTVQRLLELNEGLDPRGLQIGQQIRVR